MPGAARDLAKWAWGAGRLDVLSWQGVSKRRGETLPYCGLMLDILLDRLNPPEVIISTTGLREGLVYGALPVEMQKRDALLDGCQDLARGNLQGMHFAKPLYAFLEPLGPIMPAAFSQENEVRLRRAACHLAGIGKGLHPEHRPALVFHDVLYAPLAGLTHKERAYLALILYHSYTASQKTPNKDAIQLLLSVTDREAARIYGFAIRLGVVASARSPDLLNEFKLSLSEQTIEIDVSSSLAPLLTERVTYRLHKLGQLLGYETKIKPS
jgi:exopolyphosphatase/guanosine-5'-triphosphate,3'-diphosphate pyrophosphatase